MRKFGYRNWSLFSFLVLHLLPILIGIILLASVHFSFLAGEERETLRFILFFSGCTLAVFPQFILPWMIDALSSRSR